jgi:hypothetical protein
MRRTVNIENGAKAARSAAEPAPPFGLTEVAAALEAEDQEKYGRR